MPIILEFPAPFFLWPSLGPDFCWSCLEYCRVRHCARNTSGRTSPQDSLSSFGATRIWANLRSPPNSTPEPRTVDALPSRFLSSGQTVVSIETVTQKSSKRGRKDICAVAWFATDPALWEGLDMSTLYWVTLSQCLWRQGQRQEFY